MEKPISIYIDYLVKHHRLSVLEATLFVETSMKQDNQKTKTILGVINHALEYNDSMETTKLSKNV